MKIEKKEKKRDLSLLFFAGLAYLKEHREEFKKIERQLLLLARAGIDYLLLKNEGEKGKTPSPKVKKIKIK
jgi:hypothetical protein